MRRGVYEYDGIARTQGQQLVLFNQFTMIILITQYILIVIIDTFCSILTMHSINGLV